MNWFRQPHLDTVQLRLQMSITLTSKSLFASFQAGLSRLTRAPIVLDILYLDAAHMEHVHVHDTEVSKRKL